MKNHYLKQWNLINHRVTRGLGSNYVQNVFPQSNPTVIRHSEYHERWIKACRIPSKQQTIVPKQSFAVCKIRAATNLIIHIN